jgi:transposase-like protein
VVPNRPVYLAIGIGCEGARQVPGLRAGPGTGEPAKFWMSVLSGLRGRGVADVCIVCCDGLTGLPDAIGMLWPQAVAQLCVVHLIRAWLRYASRKYWVPLARDLRLICTAAGEAAAAAALEAFAAAWGDRYPAIITLWRAHWEQIQLEIVRKRDAHAFEVLPRRWVVERTLARITAHRRCARDYERLPESHEAMVLWAMIALMTQRLAAGTP